MNVCILCDILIELTFLKELKLIKKNASKEFSICHYWYFLNFSFKFQPNICNRCHYLLTMSMKPSDTAILNIKGSDYHCIISSVSKNEAVNFLQNADLTEKRGTLQNINNLFSYIKMDKDILMFGNIEIEKNKFYNPKTPIFFEDEDIEKVLVCNKISFGEKNSKYFIGYLYNGNKVKPLNIMLLKTCAYVKSYDGQT